MTYSEEASEDRLTRTSCCCCYSHNLVIHSPPLSMHMQQDSGDIQVWDDIVDSQRWAEDSRARMLNELYKKMTFWGKDRKAIEE